MPTRGDADDARAAYRRAIDSGDARAATEALDRLVSLLREQGDVDGARAALQQAIDSGPPHEAPYALVELGYLLRELGDAGGAQLVPVAGGDPLSQGQFCR